MASAKLRNLLRNIFRTSRTFFRFLSFISCQTFLQVDHVTLNYRCLFQFPVVNLICVFSSFRAKIDSIFGEKAKISEKSENFRKSRNHETIPEIIFDPIVNKEHFWYFHLDFGYFYPCLRCQEQVKSKARIVIHWTMAKSSDQHQQLNLERDVNRAVELLDKLQRTEYHSWLSKDVPLSKLQELQKVIYFLI